MKTRNDYQHSFTSLKSCYKVFNLNKNGINERNLQWLFLQQPNYRFSPLALIKPLNRGCGLPGRDLNSG